MSSSALKPSLKPSIKKTQTPGVNRDDNPRKKRLSVKFSQNTEVRVITASPRRHHHSRSSPGATVLSSAEFIALKNGDGSARAVEGSSDSSTDDVINDYICQFSDGENTERRVRLLNSGEDASLIDDIINGDNSDDATSMFNISSAPSLGQVADFYEPTQKVDIKGLKKVFGDSGDDSSLGIDSPGGGGGGGDVTSALGLAAPTLTDVAGFYEPTQNPSKKDLENAFKNDVEKEKKSKEKKAKNKKKKSLESAELSGIQTNILNVTDSSTDSSVLLNAPPSLTDVAGFYEQTQKPTKKELKKAFQGKERKRSAANEPSSSDTSTDISGGESNRRKSITINAPPSLADVAGFYEQTQRPSKKELKKAFSKSGRRKSRKKTLIMEENGLGSGYVPSSSDTSTSASSATDVSTSFSEEGNNSGNGEFTNLMSSVVPRLSELQNENNGRRASVVFGANDDSMEFTQVGGVYTNGSPAGAGDNSGTESDASMNLTNCYSKPVIASLNANESGVNNAQGGDDDMSLTNCLNQAQFSNLSFCDSGNDSVDMEITNTNPNTNTQNAALESSMDKGSPEFTITKNNMTASFSSIKPPQGDGKEVNSSNDDGNDSLNCEPTFLNASQFIEALSKATKSFDAQSGNTSAMDLESLNKAFEAGINEKENEKEKEDKAKERKVNFDVNDDSDSKKKKKKYSATPAASHGKLGRVPNKTMDVEESNDVAQAKKVNFADENEGEDNGKKKKKYSATPAASHGKLERVPKKTATTENEEEEEDKAKESESQAKKVNFDVNDDSDNKKKKKKYSATPAASHGKLERVPNKTMDVEESNDVAQTKKVNFADENEGEDNGKKKKKYSATPAASHGKLERVPKKTTTTENEEEEEDKAKENESQAKKVNFDVNDDSDSKKKKKKYSTTPAASQGKLERIPQKDETVEKSTSSETNKSATDTPTQSTSKKRKRTTTTTSTVVTDKSSTDKKEPTTEASFPERKKPKRQVSFAGGRESDPDEVERRKYTVTPAATQGYLTRIPNKDILTQKATYSELVARFGLRVPAKPGVYPHAAVIAAGVPFPLNPPQTPGRAAPTELELNLRAASRGQMVRVVVQFQRGLESGELPDRQQDVLTAETHLNASDCPYLYAPAEDSDKRTELERLWHIASVEAEAEAASRVLPPLCNAASAARLERVRTMRVILSKMRARLNALKERRAASDTECTRLRGALAELQEPAATAAKRRIAQAMESASPLVLMCTAGTQTGPIDPRAVLLPEENALDTLLAACGCGRIDSLWGSPRILPRHSVALTFAGSVHLTVDIPRARAVLALAKIGDNGSGNGNGDVSSSSVGVWSDWAGMCVNSLNDAVLGKAGGNRNLLGSALTEVARKLEDVYALKTDLEEAAMAVPLEFVSTPGEPPAVIATLTTSSFRLSVTLRAGLVDKNGVPCIQNHPAASYSWDFAGPVTVWWWSRSAASQAGRRVDINKDELFKKRDTPVKTSLTELLQTLKEGFERVAQTKIGLI